MHITNTRHSSDPIAPAITIIAIAAAILALIVPVSFSSPGNGPVNVAASAQGTAAPKGKNADGERATRFFGFLEFDWDPGAPGGVPGFDPWPQTPQHP